MRRRRRRDRLVVPRAVSIRDSRSCNGLIKASNESRRAADMAAASWAPAGARSPPPRGGVRGGPAALASPYGPHGKRETAWSRLPGAGGGGGGNSPPAPPSTPWRGGGWKSLPPTPPAPSGGRDGNTPPSTPPAPWGGERREYPSACAPRTTMGKRREYPSVSAPVARRATLRRGGAGVTLPPGTDPSGVLKPRDLGGSVTVAP